MDLNNLISLVSKTQELPLNTNQYSTIESELLKYKFRELTETFYEINDEPILISDLIKLYFAGYDFNLLNDEDQHFICLLYTSPSPRD